MGEYGPYAITDDVVKARTNHPDHSVTLSAVVFWIRGGCYQFCFSAF